LTGATGYIGGRLAVRLLEKGYKLRCLVRSPAKLEHRPWASDPRVEIVAANLKDVDATTEALTGCGPAYYLIHSMIAVGNQYAEEDLALARCFAEASERAGIERIVYLGGLGEVGENLSTHLSSRRDVERALTSSTVPVTVFRAAMIIGSGSASFEILRYLVERLPVMLAPRWVDTESQPIAVRNVLGYLVDCLGVPETIGRTLDIGGPDVVQYLDLLHIMSEELKLPRRVVLRLPAYSSWLSALAIHMVTPISSKLARPLAEGLRNRVVCRDDEAQRLIPQPLLTTREAMRLALQRIEERAVETAWTAAGPMPGDPVWAGGSAYIYEWTIDVETPANTLFRAICRIGGGHGWYAADPLWVARGWLDRLVGGPGLRRGRRDPEDISYGEALDFWRVVGFERDRRLLLHAEMRLPGDAWLEFLVEPLGDGSSRLTQSVRFRPRGLFGLLHWYAFLPLHQIVFGGMAKGVGREALRLAGEEART